MKPSPAEREAALRELAVTHKLSAVQNPLARRTIAKVVERLKVRLPHTCAPRPFQVIGVAFARLTGYRALFGDAMGLGKTVIALCCLAADPKALLPAVVVCPSSVLYNWRNEAEKWLPTVPVYIYNSSRKAGPGPGFNGIVVVTWDLLIKVGLGLLALQPKCVIADEAHNAKEPTAQRSRALRGFAKRVPHRLLLTGTPVKNKPSELWHLLHCISPGTWDSKASFSATYTRTRLGALNTALRTTMVRRLKQDVLTDLPDKQIVHLPVHLGANDRKEYNQLNREFVAWLKAHGESVGSSRTQALTKIGYLRRFVGRTKVAPALEQIEGFLDQGEPLVVFCEHQAVLLGLKQGLAKMNVRYGVIEGKTSSKARGDLVADFQEARIDVVLCTHAAKEGITLHRASNVLFVERWWTPGDEQQAADRCHRIGQKNAVTVWYLHAEKTLDDFMRALLTAKQSIIQGAVGDVVLASREQVFSELLDMLRSDKTPDFIAATTGGAAAAKKVAKRHLPTPERVHTLVFSPSDWTATTALQWARVNGFGGKMVSTEKGHMLRNAHPPPGPYRTVPITKSIRVVITNRAL